MKRKPGVSLTALGGVAGIMLFVLGFVVVVRVLAQPLVGESLTVVPIANGSGSLHPTSQELVIPNDTDYANFFGGTPPASPTVNFSAEDVLAVTMGSSPAGSSININSVDIRTTGFTAGWGFVHVTSVTPTIGGPITITGGMITSTGGTTTNTGGTFTVGTVLVGGTPELQFTFTGGTTSITGGTTATTGGTTTAVTPTETLTNTGGTTTTVGGTTTTTGTVIVTGGGSSTTLPPFILTGGQVSTTANVTTNGSSTTTTITGGTTTSGGGTTQPYSVVKVAKGALTYAFVNDVATTPYSGPTPFSTLSYVTSGGSAPFIDAISIDGSGNVTVNRSKNGTGGTTYIGTLTSAEIQGLNTAFINANPTTLPSVITDPSPTNGIFTEGGIFIPREVLAVLSGGSSGKPISIQVQRAGFYGGSITLKNLVDSIRGPAERIVHSTLGLGFQGHVHFVGSELRVGGSLIDPSAPFHDLIATAVGKNLAFSGLGHTGLGGNPVISVGGTVITSTPLYTFPSVGADVIATFPAGIHVDVTNLTLTGDYFEVQDGALRGYIPESAYSPVDRRTD